MSHVFRVFATTLAVSFTLAATATAAPGNAWPPKAGANFSDPSNWPNDPGYAQCKKAKDGKCEMMDGKAVITGGDWNLWSFTPPNYAATPGFRKEEIAMGVGMHADKAWTKTIGDRRVIVAVLDSGIRWSHTDLINKHYLNRGELPAPEEACRTKDYKNDPYDTNGDGIFNMLDWAKENGNAVPKTPCDSRVKDVNENKVIDPQDLIKTFSDGKDDDGNGYLDDISGWDFFRDDNDPFDDTNFGHGTGEARDSVSEGNNGRGSVGVCPECTVLNIRAADSFVADSNDFAGGVMFAVDSGAKVIQSALGAINMTNYAYDALEYAYNNNVVAITSAADELSFHHNFPGSNNHSVYVHAIVYDGGSQKSSTTFLNFNNCTNYGGQLLLSTPGTGCSSEAVGMTSGHAGLLYSAGLQAKLSPPLTAEELRGLLIMSVDDINVPESKTDPTKFPSAAGWDLHFGYGRNNVFTSVNMVFDDEVPPEVDFLGPLWFEPIEITQTPKVKINTRIGKRRDGKAARYAKYNWTLEIAKGVDPKSGWKEVAKGDTAGQDGDLWEWDAAATAKEMFDYDAPLVHHDQYTVTLRLTVTAKNKAGKEVKNEHRRTIGLYQDPDLLPGYPKRLGTSVEVSPKLFDLDGDGGDEIIVVTSEGTIHAWKADGTEAKGWPQYTPIRREFTDAWKANVKKACAYRTDKKDCLAKHATTFKPEYRETTIVNSPAIGDIDGDKDVEVIVTTFDGSLLAFHHDGTPVKGFPQRIEAKDVAETNSKRTLDDGIAGSPALADLDKDGKLEIIIGGMDQWLYVYRFDGTQQPGFPVLVSGPVTENSVRARIFASPSVGDINGDGLLDIAMGTNEVLGAASVKNEGRGYVIHGDGNNHAGGAIHKGWPVKVYGLMADVLPLIGRGVPGNPALVDIDFDGKLEINFDSIGSAGLMFRHDGTPYTWPIKGSKKKLKTFDNKNFGPKSDTKDSPAYILISNAALGKIDPKGGVDLVKSTAGFNFALTFASGGKRAEFDHHLSAWDLQTAGYLEGWPRRMDDWQFFLNPAIVDIDGDDAPEVVAGSAGYLVHAWNYLGKEPKGWPKYTNGWILASPAVGDIDGDGKYDVTTGTRNGFMFAWKGTGKVADSIREWSFYGHDLHNTNNYHSPIDPYRQTTSKPDAGGTDAGSTDGGGTSDGGTVTADVGETDAGATTTPKKKDDGGCTAQPTSTGPLGVLLVLMLLGVVLLRRREV